MKLTCRISHAFKYLLFFSSSAARRTCWEDLSPYDIASVSERRKSNYAYCCGCQTPLISKSALSPGLISVAALISGSLVTHGHARAAKSPITSRISLCQIDTRPPLLQLSACWTEKSPEQPSHLLGRFWKGRLYRRHKLSLNSFLVKTKPSRDEIGVVNQLDVFVSKCLSSLFFEKKTDKKSCLSSGHFFLFCVSNWLSFLTLKTLVDSKTITLRSCSWHRKSSK